MVQCERHVCEDMRIEMKHHTINPATKLVIPAVAERRAGIQKRPGDYWIPSFTRMTGWWISVALFIGVKNIILSPKNEPIFSIHL